MVRDSWNINYSSYAGHRENVSTQDFGEQEKMIYNACGGQVKNHDPPLECAAQELRILWEQMRSWTRLHRRTML
jgi:hypothetical protein